MELRALKSFRYAKVRLQPGDTFQAKNERDALVLTIALGGKRPLAEKVEVSNGTRKAEKEAEETGRRKSEETNDSDKHDSALAETHSEDLAGLTKAQLLDLAGKEGAKVSAALNKAEIAAIIMQGRYRR